MSSKGYLLAVTENVAPESVPMTVNSRQTGKEARYGLDRLRVRSGADVDKSPGELGFGNAVLSGERAGKCLLLTLQLLVMLASYLTFSKTSIRIGRKRMAGRLRDGADVG